MNNNILPVKSVVKLRELSADEKNRDMFERREKALRDIDARERTARTEEREKALREWQDVVADKDAEIAKLRTQLNTHNT